MQATTKAVLGSLVLAIGTHAAAQVTFFGREGFAGRSFTANQDGRDAPVGDRAIGVLRQHLAERCFGGGVPERVQHRHAAVQFHLHRGAAEFAKLTLPSFPFTGVVVRQCEGADQRQRCGGVRQDAGCLHGDSPLWWVGMSAKPAFVHQEVRVLHAFAQLRNSGRISAVSNRCDAFSCLPAGSAEGGAQARRQRVQVLVDRPEQRVLGGPGRRGATPCSRRRSRNRSGMRVPAGCCAFSRDVACC